jgi:O-antigen biosynthesis protein WbqP
MVFVGPRPALYNQDDLIELGIVAGVDKLKPGITGWAQFNVRDEISVEEKIEYEMYYMLNRSCWQDFVIVIRTFTNVILKKALVIHVN